MTIQNSKLKIVFMGTPTFGATILSGLINNGYKPILVVTEPDKPAGRRQVLTCPPVKIIAEKYKIPVSQPKKIKNYEPGIKNLKPDLIIVAAYGQILPKEILELPKYGCLNVHPSLLPKYRGPTPIQTVILNGDEKTGVTIISMDEKIDQGKIISNFQFPISKKYTYLELSQELSTEGAKLLIETIPKWVNGEIKPKPQNESRATYTKIIKKDDGKIDWKKSAKEIERQVRAFHSWPGSFTFWQKNNKLLRVKIMKASLAPASQEEKPFAIGQALSSPEGPLVIKCSKGALVILKIQLEGKKIMAPEEFLRGYPEFIDAILK